MNKVIIITGTPGVGKTTLAKWLAKKLSWEKIDLHDYYSEISNSFDKKKDCYDINLKKLANIVRKKRKSNNLIIDSHIAHLLPKSLIDVCIVLTCSNLKKLEKRLKKRKYSIKKIRENLDSEIFQVCLMEAKEKQSLVLTYDCGKKLAKRKILTDLQTRDL